MKRTLSFRFRFVAEWIKWEGWTASISSKRHFSLNCKYCLWVRTNWSRRVPISTLPVWKRRRTRWDGQFSIWPSISTFKSVRSESVRMKIGLCRTNFATRFSTWLERIDCRRWPTNPRYRPVPLGLKVRFRYCRHWTWTSYLSLTVER